MKILSLLVVLTVATFGQTKPSGLSFSNVTSNSATLSWDPQTTAGVKFYVEVSSGYSNPQASSPLVVNGLSPNTKYTWQVTAYKGSDISSGISTSSPEFTTKPASPPPPSRPKSPSIISSPDGATGVAVSTILKWSSVSDATSYHVTLSKRSDYHQALFDEDLTTTSKIASSLDQGSTYYWKVTASNAGGASDPAAASFTTVQLSPPSAPLVISPSDGESGVATTTTLRWTGAGGATSYHITLSNKSNYQQPLLDTDLSQTFTTASGLEKGATYYWKVTASNADGTSGPVTASFTIVPLSLPSAPQVLSASPTASSAQLSWNTVSDAVSYDFEAYTDAFTTPLSGGNGNVKSPPARVSGLSLAKTYYWRVRSVNALGKSDWVASSFTAPVSAPDAPVSLNASPMATGALLSWNSVPGVTSYVIELYTSRNLNIKVWNGSSSINSATVTGLASGTQYYWRVQTVNSGGSSGWTISDLTTLSAPIAPSVTLTAAAGSVTFTFTAVKGATSYDVQILDKQNNGNVVGRGSTNDASQPMIVSGLQGDTKYYYSATVTVAGLTSIPVTGSFTTNPAPPSAGLNPPSNLQVSSVVSSSASLSWDGPRQGEKFELKVSPGNISDCNASSPYPLNQLSVKTAYTWQIRTVKNSDSSAWVSGPPFTTLDASAGTLVAPSNLKVTNITSVSASLSWDGPVQGAKFELKASPGNVKDANANSPYSLSSLSPKMAYTWQIRTVKNNDTSGWVSGPSFSTLETSAGTLVDPSNLHVTNITSVSASLSWDGPAQGVKFELKVSPGNTRDVNANSPYSLSSLSPNTAYTWQIRTVKNNDTSGWVSAPSFTTLDASAGTLVAPSNLQVTNITSVSASLSWDGPAQGVKFELRVSPGNTRDANANSLYTLSSLSPNTKYTWQVRTVKNNDSSGWVPGPSFTALDASAGTLVGPSNLQATNVTSNSALLSWDGPGQGTKFEVKLSPGNLLLSNLNSSPLSVSPLSPNTTYSWQVRSTRTNDSSAWISGSSFTTASAITAVEPMTGGFAAEYSLSQNYPNPFNPVTTIQFSLPSSSNVRVTIYNALGNLVHLLVNGHYPSGRYTATWDASLLPSGVYFYRLQTDTFVDTKRLVLLK